MFASGRWTSASTSSVWGRLQWCHSWRGVLAVSLGKRKSRQLLDVPELTAEEIVARVLHRDGLMLVIDKPAGLPVHRGPKGGPNLEASFDALRFGLPRPPVLAHRLDKDTSGCLVLGDRKSTRLNSSHLGISYAVFCL